MSERVLGVSEGLAPRAPEMSDRNVNKTTKTIAREIDRNVIHLKIYIHKPIEHFLIADDQFLSLHFTYIIFTCTIT